MHIGILGSGSVGQALARGFLQQGHAVTIGSRTPEKLADFAADSGATAATFADAAQAGHLLVLATNGMATEEALGLAGHAHFAGKTVLDATNPLDFSTGQPALAISGEDSLGERVQRALPEAHVVKAYNTVPAHLMVDPDLPGSPPTMFIAGDDADAKAQARTVLEGFGWEVADVGGIGMSRHLEAMALVIIAYCFRTGDWQHAFKLL